MVSLRPQDTQNFSWKSTQYNISRKKSVSNKIQKHISTKINVTCVNVQTVTGGGQCF